MLFPSSFLDYFVAAICSGIMQVDAPRVSRTSLSVSFCTLHIICFTLRALRFIVTRTDVARSPDKATMTQSYLLIPRFDNAILSFASRQTARDTWSAICSIIFSLESMTSTLFPELYNSFASSFVLPFHFYLS